MPSSIHTVPDARLRLSEAMGQYNTASALVIDRLMGGGPLRAADDTYIRLSATYLALISIVPEEGAYWSEENQTRISLEASDLTPDERSDIIRETLVFESRPAEDPEAYAASQEELALWDSVVGDGIWASSICRLV